MSDVFTEVMGMTPRVLDTFAHHLRGRAEVQLSMTCKYWNVVLGRWKCEASVRRAVKEKRYLHIYRNPRYYCLCDVSEVVYGTQKRRDEWRVADLNVAAMVLATPAIYIDSRGDREDMCGALRLSVHGEMCDGGTRIHNLTTLGLCATLSSALRSHRECGCLETFAFRKASVPYDCGLTEAHAQLLREAAQRRRKKRMRPAVTLVADMVIREFFYENASRLEASEAYAGCVAVAKGAGRGGDVWSLATALTCAHAAAVRMGADARILTRSLAEETLRRSTRDVSRTTTLWQAVSTVMWGLGIAPIASWWEWRTSDDHCPTTPTIFRHMRGAIKRDDRSLLCMQLDVCRRRTRLLTLLYRWACEMDAPECAEELVRRILLYNKKEAEPVMEIIGRHATASPGIFDAVRKACAAAEAMARVAPHIKGPWTDPRVLAKAAEVDGVQMMTDRGDKTAPLDYMSSVGRLRWMFINDTRHITEKIQKNY